MLDFIALLKENNVVIDPTAAIFDTMLRHLPGQPDPTFAAVAGHLPPSVARKLYNPEMEIADVAESWALSAGAQSAMLKLLYDNGIQLVPGSDHMAAFTLHRELETYIEAGIPNAAVLRIATLDSAKLVGADDRTGSIAVGKQADLVLVEGDPFEDISAVRRATLVMKGDTYKSLPVVYTRWEQGRSKTHSAGSKPCAVRLERQWSVSNLIVRMSWKHCKCLGPRVAFPSSPKGTSLSRFSWRVA